MRSKCNNIGKYLAKCLAHRRVSKMIVHLSSLKFYKLVRKNRHILSVSWKGVLKSCYPGVLKMDSAVQTHGNSKYKTNQAKLLWLKLWGRLKPGLLKWPTPLHVLLAPRSGPLTLHRTGGLHETQIENHRLRQCLFYRWGKWGSERSNLFKDSIWSFSSVESQPLLILKNSSGGWADKK